MNQSHVRLRHVQAGLSPTQYEAFRAAAARQGLTLQQAAKEALLRWTRETGGEDPFSDLIGRYEGTPNASSDIDADYEAD